MTRILIVEDDPRIVSFLERGLSAEGYETVAASDGAAAVSMLVRHADEVDVVLLDLGLPQASGHDVLRLLRGENATLPVIVLTARDELAEKVRGLDLGANDYVTKPFAFAELLARIRAVLRASRAAAPSELAAGGIRLDLVAKVAWRAGERVELAPREAALLELFLRNANRVLTRNEILREVWETDFPVASNLVDVYVGYLRKKLDRPALGPAIVTARGAGYRLIEAPGPSAADPGDKDQGARESGRPAGVGEQGAGTTVGS